MEENLIVMRPIGHIRTDFATKFGVPRQSGPGGVRAGIPQP